MAVPLTALATIRDLSLVAQNDQSFDARLSVIWNEEATGLAREHEIVCEEVTLVAQANIGIYRLPVTATRLLAVFFNNVALSYTDSATLGLSNPDWVTAAAGTPRLWSINSLSPSIDSPAPTVTPRDFTITPPPAANLVTATSLKVIVISTTDTPPSWVEPWLVYRTVSRFTGENPEIGQPQKSAWFSKLATLFEKLLSTRVQI